MSAFQKITSELFFNSFLCRPLTYHDITFLSEVLKFVWKKKKMPCRQRSEKKPKHKTYSIL